MLLFGHRGKIKFATNVMQVLGRSERIENRCSRERDPVKKISDECLSSEKYSSEVSSSRD